MELQKSYRAITLNKLIVRDLWLLPTQFRVNRFCRHSSLPAGLIIDGYKLLLKIVGRIPFKARKLKTKDEGANLFLRHCLSNLTKDFNAMGQKGKCIAPDGKM